MTILIQNGQVINPATGMNEVADVLVENGVVSKIEKGIIDFKSYILLIRMAGDFFFRRLFYDFCIHDFPV